MRKDMIGEDIKVRKMGAGEKGIREILEVEAQH